MLKKSMYIIIILLTIFINTAYANPIFNTIDGNWTKTILVYSNDKINVYIPEDSINFNVLHTNYRNDGNFTVEIFTELKDEELRQSVINSVKNDNNISITDSSIIDSIQYIENSAFFDYKKLTLEKSRVNIHNSMFLSENSKVIAMKQLNQIVYLFDNKCWLDISANCNELLRQYMNRNDIKLLLNQVDEQKNSNNVKITPIVDTYIVDKSQANNLISNDPFTKLQQTEKNNYETSKSCNELYNDAMDSLMNQDSDTAETYLDEVIKIKSVYLLDIYNDANKFYEQYSNKKVNSIDSNGKVSRISDKILKSNAIFLYEYFLKNLDYYKADVCNKKSDRWTLSVNEQFAKEKLKKMNVR